MGVSICLNHGDDWNVRLSNVQKQIGATSKAEEGKCGQFHQSRKRKEEKKKGREEAKKGKKRRRRGKRKTREEKEAQRDEQLTKTVEKNIQRANYNNNNHKIQAVDVSIND